MPASAKCPSCGLLQWIPVDGLCRRCAALLPAGPAPGQPSAAATPSSSYQPLKRWLPWLAVGALLLVAAPVGWQRLRSALHLHDARVTRFEDTTGLVRLRFLEPGWRYLGLARPELRTPFERNEPFLETVRGAFYLRDGEDGPPIAVVYFRIEGILGFSAQRLADEDRVRLQHQGLRQTIAALGGEYTPAGTNGGTDEAAPAPFPGLKLEMGRFKPIRVEGTARVPDKFFLWYQEGPYRLVTLIALEYSRTYYVHIVYPESSQPLLAPLTRVLREADFTKKPG